jgi:RecA/RadA recombinase
MLSGSLDGGLKAGLTQVVGDSRTFKSNFCLVLVKAYLDKYPDAVCIFLDNEFGAAQYFKPMGIDPNRVIHLPVTDVEDMKQRTVSMLESIEPGEKVIFFLDSLSQIASLKETEDAISGKVVADMTRAKMINSYMRIITPRVTMKKIPFLFINNYYDDTSSPYAEPILKGGKQAFLSSDTIFFVTRSQIKDADKVLRGWSFNYTAMKSRTVKEKSKFGIEVFYDGGVNEDSGLFDLAIESGFVTAPKQGWYQIHLPGQERPSLCRKKDIEEDKSFFKALVTNANFKDYIHNKYALESGEMFESKLEIIDDETGEVVVVGVDDKEGFLNVE